MLYLTLTTILMLGTDFFDIVVQFDRLIIGTCPAKQNHYWLRTSRTETVD